MTVGWSMYGLSEYYDANLSRNLLLLLCSQLCSIFSLVSKAKSAVCHSVSTGPQSFLWASTGQDHVWHLKSSLPDSSYQSQQVGHFEAGGLALSSPGVPWDEHHTAVCQSAWPCWVRCVVIGLLLVLSSAGGLPAVLSHHFRLLSSSWFELGVSFS